MNDPRPAENTPATGGDFAHAGRRIEIAVEVPGTPEEVWDAVATGPGISSWFIPMEVEERTGGEVVMDWGSFGRETAEVAVWDPPHRVVFRGPDEGALAFEWLVEAQGGGSCVVRLVNSGFGEGDEWDGQYHGMAEGWKIFLEHLRLQRTHFPGARARAAIPTVMAAGPRAEAWATFCGHLGIPADAAPGDRIVTSGDAPELRARVETVLRTDAAVAYLLLVEHPAPGTAFLTVEGDGDQVAASTYLYLYDGAGGPADPALGQAWVDWLTATYPGDQPAELLT